MNDLFRSVDTLEIEGDARDAYAALCGCVAAGCGASATSEKKTPLCVWSMYLVGVAIL